MFKPHKGICICHNQQRWIVVKAGYCKQGNDEQKGKNSGSGKKITSGAGSNRRVNFTRKTSGFGSNHNPSKGKWKHSSSNSSSKGILRKPIAKKSEKRKKQEIAYQALRKVYLATHPHCEANIPGVCSGEPAHEIHHQFSGKDREKYFLDATTWKAVERSCHDWIHLHPIEAREMGLLK
jgi:hypothetical protein